MGELEATVVERAAQGDQNAFARLMEAHKDMIYTICHRTLGNEHDAEEVLQDTFVSAFRNLPRFRGDSKISTWLYRIAVNRCRDFLDSKKARHASSTSSIDDGEAPLRDTLASADSDAGETVREALALIPQEYGTAIRLHCIMDYSYDEAGEIMGIPGGTVKTYVHRGKQALRDVLVGQGRKP